MKLLNGIGFSPWKENSIHKYIKLWPMALSLAIGLLAFGSVAYRINQAPDIFTDEIIYTRIGIRVAGEGALVWDSGEPFMVHPPLYFLLEGIYFIFTGNRNTPIFAAGNIFDAVYHARYINAFLAGLTGVIFFWLGKRLYNIWLGLLLAVIFILDPFGIRINPRAMLETLAMMLTLAGMLVFLGGDDPGRRKPFSLPNILAGLLFGASLLAKELVFTNLVVLLLFASLQTLQHKLDNPTEKNHFSSFYSAGVSILIAIATYCIYPFWTITSATWGEYLEEKFSGIERLVGLLQLTGWNRPGISFVSLLIQRLVDYGSSYLLLALGGLATLGLLIWGRHTWKERLLLAWGLVLYPFFVFVALVGSGNDQFFYFLLVPAIVLVGYAFVSLPPRLSEWMQDHLPKKLPLLGKYAGIVSKLPVVVLLVILLPYNGFVWIVRNGADQDNGYARLTEFVNTSLPVDIPLNASGDPIKFHYFMPNRPIISVSTPDQAMAAGVHYFALAPKDAQLRYGNSSPELADWIQGNGELLYSTNSHSYGELYLYHVDYPDGKSTPPLTVQGTGAHWRSFQPAEGGFVASLFFGLFLWGLIWSLIILRMSIHIRNEEAPQLQPSTAEEWVKLASRQADHDVSVEQQDKLDADYSTHRF